MSVEIKPVGQSATVNIGIYGDIGSRKTSFIGSGGQDYNILIIRPPVEHVDPILNSGCKEAVVRDWEDMADVEEQLGHAKPGEWDWVWLDGISTWQDFGLRDVLEATYDRAGPPGSTQRKNREQFRADKGEYNINAQRISDLMRNLVGSEQFNFGWTAHAFWGPRLVVDDEAEPADAPAEMIQPWIQVKGMPPKICGMMNLIGYMDVAERVVRGQTKPYGRMLTNKGPRHYAKCQYNDPAGINIFGESGIIVNPTLPKMMQAIEATRQPRRRRTRRSA